MKHLNKFNEHVYVKASNTESKKWMDNFNELFKYLKNQISNRQVKNFTKDGENMSFTILGRKYLLDTKNNSITLYINRKKEENPIKLDLVKDQVNEIIDLLKKPIQSPRSIDKGKKPYLD